MNRNGFRWTHLCVSATTALMTGGAWNSATASQAHVLQHGETLASIARHYHVSVQDIVTANALGNPNSVRDGHRLIIPDPPRRVFVPQQIHQSAKAISDRVNVRLGPGSDYRSIWMFDKGASVNVTAVKGEWAQVAVPGGRTGWVRHDLIKTNGKAEPVKQAHTPASPAHAPKSNPVALVGTDRTRKTAISRPASKTAGVSRKQHETHPVKLSAHVAAHGRKAVVAMHSVPAKHAQAHVHHAETQRHASTHAQPKHQAAHHASHSSHVAKLAHHSSGHGATHSARHLAHHNAPTRHQSSHYIAEADAPGGDTDIVRTAYSYRGTPYRYGSSGRGSFDCSGFTSYLYAKKGVALPHSAKGQFSQGSQVSKDSMKPGDLVFFHTVTSGISHVGMYVGNGKFVHCSSRRSGGVRVDNLDSGYYSKAFRGARRVKD